MKARPFIVRGLFILSAIMLVAAVVVTSSRRSVAAETKAVGGISYGYQLESYRFRQRMLLRFWNSNGFTLDCDLPGDRPGELQESRWLAGEGAIYLRMIVDHHDGQRVASVPVKILFDFRSGELSVSAPIALWRVPAGTKGDGWLTDQEFESALAKYAVTK